LPESSASLPSALKRRRKKSPGLAPERSRNSMPSAPTPVVRAQRLRASSACAHAAAASSMMRKSFPQACALTKEITRTLVLLFIPEREDLVSGIAGSQLGQQIPVPDGAGGYGEGHSRLRAK